MAALKALMRRVGKSTLYDMFDIICGTSTGGIIAALIGMKFMPIDEVRY